MRHPVRTGEYPCPKFRAINEMQRPVVVVRREVSVVDRSSAHTAASITAPAARYYVDAQVLLEIGP